MKIQNRFRVLLAEKATKAGRTISLREVARETRISPTTLVSWSNNRTKQFDTKTIAALCDYFECTPCELIVALHTE